MKLTFIVILYLLSFLLSAVTVESGSNYTVPSSKVSELIRLHFLSASSSAEYSLNGSPIHSAEMLRHFYKTRDFQSAWSANAQSFEQARILLNLIEGVQSHGLIPEYYHIDKIKSLIKYSRDAFDTSGLTPQQFAELDMLFTDAFLTLGCHFSGGCLAPLIAEAEWHANQDAININAVLETALSENTIQKSLHQLLPLQEGYEKLRKGLQRYRTIQASGGWPKIRSSTILMRGDRTEQIVNLRDRLIASGDMKYNNKENATVFDQEIINAVIRFQERNGLNPDGIVGPLTIEALNIPVETRIRQIELNLERMRWTSRDTGHRYIMVNIAGFKLDVIENGNKTMSMDVIVGKPYWHTPVLSETMTYIVLNPSWIIPESIAAEEILPKIRENPDYLTMLNIKVMTNWSQDATEINSRTIKWFEIDEDNFHYKLIQQPGTSNPLGNIKFIFPNKYNVYLHDTPGKGLFSRNIRSFSHGCIRIEKPLELAEYLLKENHGWTRNKILSVIKKGKAQTVYLSKPIRIHLLYLTAWVDEEDMIQFRNDIYRRDERLYMALLNRPARLTNASKLTFTLH